MNFTLLWIWIYKLLLEPAPPCPALGEIQHCFSASIHVELDIAPPSSLE